MYPQHVYPPGPEYAPGQGQMSVEASRSPARYPYMPYYSSKGPEHSAYGGMVGGGLPPGHPYSGKHPRGLPGQELMYGQNWNSMMQGQGYMGAPPMKVDMGGPYGMQVKLMGMGSQKFNFLFFFLVFEILCVCARQKPLQQSKGALLCGDFIEVFSFGAVVSFEESLKGLEGSSVLCGCLWMENLGVLYLWEWG